MIDELIASSLEGQRVIITGAASGLGAAAAFAATKCSMKVLAVDRDEGGLTHLAGRCEGQLEILTVDLGEEKSSPLILEKAVRSLGGVDSLFHCAAALRRQYEITEVSADDYDLHYRVNQRATWLLARDCAEQMSKQASLGAMVLVSSLGASTGGLGGSWLYASTKGAVEVMVRSFARQYGPAGVRTNAISPGAMDTPMLHGDLKDGQLAEMVERFVPLKRAADPMEVANVGLFLMSAAASYINGVTIDVDGGWNCR